METISALLSLCVGNSPVIGEFPHKDQWRWALMISLISPWTNGWVNNRDTGDLKHHYAHYDVTEIKIPTSVHIALQQASSKHSTCCLIHCSQDKMHTSFPGMKMIVFRSHWSLFIGVHLTIRQYWFIKWLGTWHVAGPDHWHRYVT